MSQIGIIKKYFMSMTFIAEWLHVGVRLRPKASSRAAGPAHLGAIRHSPGHHPHRIDDTR